eukprot:g3972.t1
MASESSAPAGPEPGRSPKRSTWVECATPTTGRKYYIHRRTGKISWTDPFAAEAAESTGGSGEARSAAAGAERRAHLVGQSKGRCPPSPIHVRKGASRFRPKGAAAGGGGTGDSTREGSSNGAAAAKPFVSASPAASLARDSRIASLWTSDETRLMRSFCKRWKARHERKAVFKWKLWLVESRAHERVRAANESATKLKTKMKLEHTRNELAMARAEVYAWKRAKGQKDAILRKSAARRLQKWFDRYSSQVKVAWDCWVRWNSRLRAVEMAELRERAAEARALKQRVSELEEVVDANQRDREKLQIELESWSSKARVCEEELDMLQSRAVVDINIHERCIAEKEHFETLTKEKTDELDALRATFMRQKEQWSRRFAAQQEVIERLENDVEELSELKVLELAENYYDSVTT